MKPPLSAATDLSDVESKSTMNTHDHDFISASISNLPPISDAASKQDQGDGHRASKNPFKLPKGGEWLSIRRQYATELYSLRAKERNNLVYDKHTFRTRHTGGGLPRLRKLLNSYDKETEATLKKSNLTDVEKAFDIVKNKNPYRSRPIQREFVSDIISNKREIFLAEYVLQTKKQSLTKLQRQVHIAEQKLAEAEKKLEIDATMFDDFLKQTDKSAVDAMHEAERVSHIRQTLVEQEKKLWDKKATLQSELSRFDEKLFNYLEMKKFIWRIYSDQHPDDRHAKRIIKHIDMMTKDAYSSNTSTLVDQALVADLDETEQIMPFKKTADILEIITELEDANLQMIHHFQHSEEVVEDMKNAQHSKSAALNQNLTELRRHIKMLTETIDAREKRAKELAFVCRMYEVGSHEQDMQERVLQELAGKIEKVYRGVVGSLEIKIDGLMMLTSIENRLTDLIEEVEAFPVDKVRHAQKYKDKQRRLKMREEKLEKQKQKQEERAKRAQERAATVAFRTTKGRRLVFRSDPVKKGHSTHYHNALKRNGEEQDKDAEFFRADNYWS